MIDYFIVCRRAEAPVPEQLVDALVKAGHRADLVEVTRSFCTASTAEIALGANRSRIYVDWSEDFEEGHDLSTSDWEMVEELVEPEIARTPRRLITVLVWGHADPAAVKYLVKIICVKMDGRLAGRQAP